jgi:hypothetical protein
LWWPATPEADVPQLDSVAVFDVPRVVGEDPLLAAGKRRAFRETVLLPLRACVDDTGARWRGSLRAHVDESGAFAAVTLTPPPADDRFHGCVVRRARELYAPSLLGSAAEVAVVVEGDLTTADRAAHRSASR